MERIVDCFLPLSEGYEIIKTVACLKAIKIVNNIILLKTANQQIPDALKEMGTLTIDHLESSKTMQTIAAHSQMRYTLLYLKEQYLEMGLYALERMVSIAQDSAAGMVYADHYKVS